MLLPTGRLLPPAAPVNLAALTLLIEMLAPEVRVWTPEAFETYDLMAILDGSSPGL
jgi:hypothetical protein